MPNLIISGPDLKMLSDSLPKPCEKLQIIDNMLKIAKFLYFSTKHHMNGKIMKV